MFNSADIPIGTRGIKELVVTRELTVGYVHAAMPEVYATPMMIYLMENTAAESIIRYLPEGWVTVGVAVNIRHLAATPVGFNVTARSEVIAVDDKTVTFKVEADNGLDKIGEGTHTRAFIEKGRFAKHLAVKMESRLNKQS